MNGISIQKLKLSSSVDNYKIFGQLFLSLFYMSKEKNNNEQFFFGRTVRSSKLEMKAEKDGSFSAKKDEHFYFHTGLTNIPEIQEKIFIVFEAVIIVYPNN